MGPAVFVARIGQLRPRCGGLGSAAWWLGEYVFGFGVRLLGGVWGKGTNGLKARGAACHKKSRLSAGGVGAAASGAHIKNPVFGRVCWCRRRWGSYKKYPRLGRGRFLLFNYFFNNFVRFGFCFSEFYGLGKQG